MGSRLKIDEEDESATNRNHNAERKRREYWFLSCVLGAAGKWAQVSNRLSNMLP